jgi:hypothetical protein
MTPLDCAEYIGMDKVWEDPARNIRNCARAGMFQFQMVGRNMMIVRASFYEWASKEYAT